MARKPEAIYVCSSRKAAIAAAETEAAATSSSLVPSARSNTPTSCPSSAQGEDRAAIGTAPWVSLSTLTAPSNAQGHAQGSPAPGAQGATHHFQACVVCQRMGSGKSLTTTSHTSTSHNGATSPNSTETPGAGPLLLCSTCPAAFHLPCLRPRLRAMPKKGKGGSKWSCAYCYATGRRWGGDSDGACGAVRLMESLRQSMQGSIRVRFIYLAVRSLLLPGKNKNVCFRRGSGKDEGYLFVCLFACLFACLFMCGCVDVSNSSSLPTQEFI